MKLPSKQKMERIAGVVGCMYFFFLVFFPIFPPSEWIYYAVLILVTVWFIIYRRVLRKGESK
jgi:hypothetical protein